jgi:3-oxoadipate enol-lactonase
MSPISQTGIFKTSDSTAIHYSLHGAHPSAPRLALIHSLALDESIWEGVVAKLANQFEILTYDCRGHGKSERRPETFTTDLFARDLAELLDLLGWTATVVAGCSMGGCVAQTFAGLYSSRVTALGLIDTTAWYGEDAPRTWRERAAMARSKGLKSMVEFQTTRWFSDKFRDSNPDLVKRMSRIFLANNLDCYAATCVMLGDADLRAYLPTFRMPVAVLVGEEDYATPIAMARQLNETIPGSTFQILPGARHLAPVECPNEIASSLRDLLSRIGSQKARVNS